MKVGAGAHGQGGFSLMELMVSIVIGMFGVLVVMQVLASTAASRRIAVGGGDAQLNALSAVRALELDVEHAGLGLQSFNISGCSLSYTTGTDGASVTLAALAPVVINPSTALVPAGDANTDTLIVSSGNSGSPNEGDALTATTTSTSYVVTTPDSFAVGDRVVAAPSTRASTCALQLGKVSGVAAYALTLGNGTAGLAIGSIVYNLGATPTVRAYAIRNGDLTVCDYLAYNCGSTAYTATLDSNVWVPVASNIVSLRAQYARDTSGISGSTSTMDGVVDRFDQTTPASTDAIPVYCGWARVVGLRMAVVARSQQYDKALVYSDTSTSASALKLPTWAGSTANTTTTATLTTLNPTAVPITLTATTGYDRYRYQTLETMVPIRNAIWQGAQPTYQGGSGAC